MNIKTPLLTFDIVCTCREGVRGKRTCEGGVVSRIDARIIYCEDPRSHHPYLHIPALQKPRARGLTDTRVSLFRASLRKYSKNITRFHAAGDLLSNASKVLMQTNLLDRLIDAR